MSRNLARIVSILMIPCLLADSVIVYSFQTMVRRPQGGGETFSEQALELPADEEQTQIGSRPLEAFLRHEAVEQWLQPYQARLVSGKVPEPLFSAALQILQNTKFVGLPVDMQASLFETGCSVVILATRYIKGKPMVKGINLNLQTQNNFSFYSMAYVSGKRSNGSYRTSGKQVTQDAEVFKKTVQRFLVNFFQGSANYRHASWFRKFRSDYSPNETAPKTVKSITAGVSERPSFSEQELVILEKLALGLLDKEISTASQIKESSVVDYIQSIWNKLGMDTTQITPHQVRSQLAKHALNYEEFSTLKEPVMNSLQRLRKITSAFTPDQENIFNLAMKSLMTQKIPLAPGALDVIFKENKVGMQNKLPLGMSLERAVVLMAYYGAKRATVSTPGNSTILVVLLTVFLAASRVAFSQQATELPGLTSPPGIQIHPSDILKIFKHKITAPSKPSQSPIQPSTHRDNPVAEIHHVQVKLAMLMDRRFEGRLSPGRIMEIDLEGALTPRHILGHLQKTYGDIIDDVSLFQLVDDDDDKVLPENKVISPGTVLKLIKKSNDEDSNNSSRIPGRGWIKVVRELSGMLMGVVAGGSFIQRIVNITREFIQGIKKIMANIALQRAGKLPKANRPVAHRSPIPTRLLFAHADLWGITLLLLPVLGVVLFFVIRGNPTPLEVAVGGGPAFVLMSMGMHILRPRKLRDGSSDSSGKRLEQVTQESA